MAAVLAACGLARSADAQVVSVFKKITQADLTAPIATGYRFGSEVEPLGDLDGAGPSVLALAVGLPHDSSVGNEMGGVFILFLDANGDVLSEQKIDGANGGLDAGGNPLDEFDRFGHSLAYLGDLDGVGGSAAALAVSAPNDDDGGVGQMANWGAVYVLFLNSNGTVSSRRKISGASGDLPVGALDDVDKFGGNHALAALGDLDGAGPGVVTLAAGAAGDDDGGIDTGAVWLLSLDATGASVATSKINDATLGGDVLLDGDQFARGVEALGDLDGPGPSIAAMTVGAGGGAISVGDQYVLFLITAFPTVTLSTFRRITAGESGFSGDLGVSQGGDADNFGSSAVSLGDLDGDGALDLFTGAQGDDDGGATFLANRGAAWHLALQPDGIVRCHQKVSATIGGLPAGSLDDADLFGTSLASLGDLDGDGTTEVAVGAMFDDDGGTDLGAVWLLSVEDVGCDVPVIESRSRKISSTQGGFTGPLSTLDLFGAHVADLGDLDGAGPSVKALAVGARHDTQAPTCSTGCGAVYILFIDETGLVLSETKITEGAGGFPGSFNETNLSFGFGIESLGDLDGAGGSALTIAVTSPGDDDGPTDSKGALWILRLDSSGTVTSGHKIAEGQGGLTADIENGDEFGTGVAVLGDLDGAGPSTIALAVGAHHDDGGGSVRGAVWILFLDSAGQVMAAHPTGGFTKINDVVGGAPAVLPQLDDGDLFGSAVESLGDLDGLGPSVHAIAVQAQDDDDGNFDSGAVWILFLNADGTVASSQKISGTEGGMQGDIPGNQERFGEGLAAIPDRDGDGTNDLVVSFGGGLGGPQPGGFWILLMNPDGTVKGCNELYDVRDGRLAGLADRFGDNATFLGDLDGAGPSWGALAISAIRDDDGGTPPNAERGAFWILFLDDQVTCESYCGDSRVDGGEECDDGNLSDGDGCSGVCLDETCAGDGDCETANEVTLPFTPVTTDSEGDGATVADTVETEVTPISGGPVSIVESTYAGPPPPLGYSFLDRKVEISAPPATPLLPLQIIFELHSSLVSAGELPFLNVLRNSHPVRACQSFFASPDPCRWSCASGANPRVCIRSSKASLWTLGVGGCSFQPLPSCRTADKSTLLVKDAAKDKGDTVVWTWTKGDATDAAVFGTPDLAGGTDYSLCLYDESAKTLEDPDRVTEVLHATAVAGSSCDGKPCWTALGNPPGSKGYKYKASVGSPEGLITLLLKPGPDGKARLVAKAKGETLSMLGEPALEPPTDPLPLEVPVRVQVQASNGECWEAEYDSASVKVSTDARFKAKVLP